MMMNEARNRQSQGEREMRVRFNRGNYQSTVLAARRLAEHRGSAVFIVITAYGYAIDHRAPAFRNEPHYIVSPNSEQVVRVN